METMNSINERLAYIIKREGHTVSSFAKKCGLPDPTIRNLLPSAKTNRRPSYDIIVAIIAAVDQPWCDANWFVLGEQPASESTDAKKLLKIIDDQQKTINELQRKNGDLTDRLLSLLQPDNR
jgi:transcriptional regulator with XRE-family HTH domain